jgi:hypothetical protein
VKLGDLIADQSRVPHIVGFSFIRKTAYHSACKAVPGMEAGLFKMELEPATQVQHAIQKWFHAHR